MCPSKLVNSFFWYVSWFIFPPLLKKQYEHMLTDVHFSLQRISQEQLMEQPAFFASEISFPISTY